MWKTRRGRGAEQELGKSGWRRLGPWEAQVELPRAPGAEALASGPSFVGDAESWLEVSPPSCLLFDFCS